MIDGKVCGESTDPSGLPEVSPYPLPTSHGDLACRQRPKLHSLRLVQMSDIY